MSFFRTHRLKLLAATSVAGLLTIQTLTPLNPLGRLITTPGVQNIEARYSSGGGAKSHQPGAATARGASEKEAGRTKSQQGVGTEGFEERVGEQRTGPDGLDKAWNSMRHKQERDK